MFFLSIGPFSNECIQSSILSKNILTSIINQTFSNEFAIFINILDSFRKNRYCYIFDVILTWFVIIVISPINNWRFFPTLKQLRIFAGSRLLTLGLDALLTFGTVWILQTAGYKEFTLTFIITLTVTADLISKIVAAVFVVISNYFISKIFVFKNKKN